MSERFTTLYRIPGNLYTTGSPIIIAAGALLKDNQTGKVLAQIKFKSISDKRIKAVKIRVLAFDVMGLALGDAVEHQYLDLNVNRNDEFGSKEAVPLALDTTRSFRAQISNVVYSDGSIWDASNDTTWNQLEVQKKLSDLFKDNELVRQYVLETGDSSQYVPVEIDDLWICSCGTANHKSEEHCVSCKKALTGLLAGLDVSMLTAKKDARLEEQCAAEKKSMDAQRQKEEEQRLKLVERIKKTKKFIVITGSISLLVAITIILTFSVFIPQSQYSDALVLFENGNYSEAEKAFSALGNYKDSSDMEKECVYQEALLFVNESKYTDAVKLFLALGEYKDSENKMHETYYALGDVCLENKDYAGAVTAFTNAGTYSNSVAKAKIANYYTPYESAEDYFAAGNIYKAYKIYKELPSDFENVQERITLIEPYLSLCGSWEQIEPKIDSFDYYDRAVELETRVIFDDNKAFLLVTGWTGDRNGWNCQKELVYGETVRYVLGRAYTAEEYWAFGDDYEYAGGGSLLYFTYDNGATKAAFTFRQIYGNWSMEG